MNMKDDNMVVIMDEFEKVYEDIELKFTSGNKIPVTRATITIEEWSIIKKMLKKK